MLDVLNNKTYRRLLSAQMIALVGTGLATVALGLLAYDLAPGNAGAVLGTALAIKMLAYIGVAPIANAFAQQLPRKKVLVTLDLVRALVVLFLPFVTQIWQVYVLIFVLQAASAGFTPTFQATIPDVLPDEEDYTKALSLSRIAYDLESLVSPLLAAVLLGVIGFHNLFVGTAIGFIVSAILVSAGSLPMAKPSLEQSIYERTTRGLRIYLATPRLRGLLAVSMAVAAGASMVFVNTVPIVQGALGLTAKDTAWALASFGAGSMLAAMFLPSLLLKHKDRSVMLWACALLACGVLSSAWAQAEFLTLLPLWFILGVAYGVAQTPSGRLLRKSAHPEDRPALFAANFALSHACWLLAYPVAGWIGARWGIDFAALVLFALCALALGLAVLFWPAKEDFALIHTHAELPAEHDHWRELGATATKSQSHQHEFVIDDLHPRWPR